MPLHRRSLLLAPLAVLPVNRAYAETTQAGVPANRRLAFDVLRNDSPIGTHVLTFAPAAGRLVVNIDIKIAAGIGPITLYRYEMQGTETWDDGQFVALDTTSNDDGTPHRVSVRRTEGGLSVQSSGFPDITLPGDTLPLTHWCEAALSHKLISPQDGQVMIASVTPAGPRSIARADGQSVSATGFHVATKTPLVDWYDAGKIWVGLDADAKDGSKISYRMA